jgi:hypothetical protein
MHSFATARFGRKTLYALAAVIALVFGGSAVAGAVGSSADEARSTGGASAKVVGSTSGDVCGMAYDTETSSVTPPDDTTTDNAPAGAVSLVKKCRGAVIATFSGELNMPSASAFFHMDVRATCTDTGGFDNPCTVGQQVFGQPGHTFLVTGQDEVGVHTMRWVLPNLKKGTWSFEALPGGDGAAFTQFRTFTVEAFNGG